MALNPFVWDRPLDDLTKIVGMDDFAREVALTLKAQTNVAIFGARNTGKSTFLTALARELALEHEADAPPHVVVRIDLKRALSIPAFVSCVVDALHGHPDPLVRRAGARELARAEVRRVGRPQVQPRRPDHGPVGRRRTSSSSPSAIRSAAEPRLTASASVRYASS